MRRKRFYQTILSEFQETSTYHGTALMVLALAYWLPILGPDAMQELGWHEPRWSGAVWNAQRPAEVIGRRTNRRDIRS